MTTPYITPGLLRNFPSGLDLTLIPYTGASDAVQADALLDLCNRATAEIVRCCHQELRATLNTDTCDAPSLQCGVNNQGIAEFRTLRFPVLQVLGGGSCPAVTFPRVYTAIPATAMAPKTGIPGQYGTIVPDAAAVGPNTILIAPGYVTWWRGRGGTSVQVQYLNGWPHCGLTVNALAGDPTIHVDDVTGWPGVTGTIFDGANTETVFVTSVAADFPTTGPTPVGPGMLTLQSALLYNHTIPTNDKTILVTSMPPDIQTAACYMAIEQILLEGTQAVTIPTLPGAETHEGGLSAASIHKLAEDKLGTYAVTTWG